MEKVNAGIFKAYDIRGIFPTDLDENIAYRIGNAYAQYVKPSNVVVGGDMRVGTPSVKQGLINGLADAGVDVTDVGMISTDMIYFAVGKYGFAGGITVTASHNPKEWIGMKMVREEAIPLSGDTGIPVIRDLVVEGKLVKAEKRGEVTTKDIYAEFVEHVLGFIEKDSIKPLKVVIDTANGMGSALVEPVFKHFPCEVIPMYFEIDGTFPNHEANPLLEENTVDIRKKVLEVGADLGIAFDGDADRCFFIDDKGEFVAGDFVTALLSRAVVTKNPGGSVLYDVRASWAVKDLVEAAGGKAFMNRVGHAFFKQRMRDEGGLFGGEVSGHYYYKNHWNCDSGIIPAIVVLEMLSKEGKKLSEIIAELKEKYFITGEINSKVEDVQGRIDALKEKYADGNMYFMDGISVEYKDWHFNVRPSNTEPLLRLNLEAMDEQTMKEKRDEVLAIIRA